MATRQIKSDERIMIGNDDDAKNPESPLSNPVLVDSERWATLQKENKMVQAMIEKNEIIVTQAGPSKKQIENRTRNPLVFD